MAKLNKLVWLLCSITILQGCSSVLSISASNKPSRECDSHIYGGTKLNTKIITGNDWLFEDFRYALIIDYPFSLVADTVFIPYTVYKTIECTNESLEEKYKRTHPVEYLNQKKLEAEKPIYLEYLSKIKNNPQIILSDEIYLLKSMPIRRAVFQSFSDETVVFPDETLTLLLDILPEDKRYFRAAIFSQPSLSTKSIEKYFPAARDWNHRIDGSIFASIAKNPNTPKYILEEIASINSDNYGAVQAARQKLQNLK